MECYALEDGRWITRWEWTFSLRYQTSNNPPAWTSNQSAHHHERTLSTGSFVSRKTSALLDLDSGSSKEAIKRYLFKCLTFKRHRAVLHSVNGPASKTTSVSAHFHLCRLGFFYHFFWITIYRHKEKRYVFLFTCLNTRSVHLEVTAFLRVSMPSHHFWPTTVCDSLYLAYL